MPSASALLRPGVLALALLCVTWSHWPLLVEDPLLTRDDRSLIDPLRRIDSVGEYRDALSQRRLLDLQPVRDASFAVNLWLEAKTGHGLFHATNLLIWAAVVVLLYRLLRTLPVPAGVAVAAAALFAVHPTFAMATAWVAARKHLLSCLFILVATLGVRRAVRRQVSAPLVVGTVAAYALSVFSQPITLLWPLWAAVTAWVEDRSRRKSLLLIPLLCLPVTIACGWLNLTYYSGTYVEQVAAQKFVEGNHLGISLLAFGRSFFNLVMPVRIATSYDPGSPFNLAGLLLLAPFGFWVWKRLPPREVISWGLFFSFPLAVVFGRMTQIFLSDPYLLTPGIGLTCLAVQLAAPLGMVSERRRRLAVALSLLVGGALLWSQRQVALSWRSEASVWARAYEIEPTPNALAKQAYFLASSGKTDEALEVALRLKRWAPAHAEAEFVLARAIFLDRELSDAQKDQLLLEHGLPGPWTAYFHAIVRARLGRFVEADALMREALKTPTAFKEDLAAVVAEATLLCRRAQRASCEDTAQRFRGQPAWSEERFRRRLNQR